MPSGETLSDDYVASLLAKDAKDSNIKYSSYGLGALLPKRPTTNAPKPNTRFLKNIIKETDSHNAALKAKETEDAKARLRRLRDGARRESDSQANGEVRRSAKRQRVEDGDGIIRKGRGHKSNLAQQLRENDDYNRKRQRRRHDDDSSEDERVDPSHRHKRHRSHQRHRSRSGDRSKDRDGYETRKDHHRRRSRSRSRSPRAHRDSKHRRSRRRRSPSTSSDSQSDASPRRKPEANGRNSKNPPSKPKNGKLKRMRSPTPNSASDSDPLASLIGPPPPPSPPKVRSRGRGTFASNSGIDTRFSNTYDPTMDVHPDPDSENDWDQALEALRDRQKWKQQGADRLREAGFTEEEVQKWEKSGPSGEKREEDVVWKGRGEGREWDRGKVVTVDGDEVVTKAEWGRLV